MAIPKGITRADILAAIQDYDAGVPHPYRPSTKYDLRHRGRLYPPKAIVGLAARRLNGGVPLNPERDFSGGSGPSAANRVLTDRGFAVIDKAVAARESTGRRDWTGDEVGVLLPAYFGLLHADLAGTTTVKRDVTRQLEAQLPGRTRGSIEFKFENVSAVLQEEGLPWTTGFKPARNFQQLLREAVLERLDGPEQERRLLAAAAAEPRPEELAEPRSDRQVDPPRSTRRSGRASGPAVRIPRDALADAANRALGRAGEQWVVELEVERLRMTGHDALASRVEWVAKERGDGLGYDVLSFERDGSERWIEVKTTNSGESAPFLITRNELAIWSANPDKYRLVRLFRFSQRVQYYELRGEPESCVELEPTVWEARPT
jgi:hypothetical protein